MARIAVEILGDASSLERAYKKAARDTDKFGEGVTRVGKTGSSMFSGLGKAAALAGGAIGIGGLAEAAKASFERMTEMQRTAAQTAAALKSTHDAAGISAEGIDQLSASMSKLSGTDSESIHSGENVLLMFTNVRNEVGKGNDIFNQASLAALNLSSRLGIDMPAAAKLVGKALGDPVKGLGALRRVGIEFTADQTKLIKKMVESGHTMDAQKLILAGLTTRFGGAARAAGETLTGKLNTLKVSLLDMGAKIAGQLAPAITQLIGKLTDWLSKTKNQKLIMDIAKGAMSALTTAVRILRGAFGFLSGIVGGNANAIKVLIGLYAAWKIAGVVSALVGLATQFGLVTVAEGEAAVATEGLAIALGPAVLVAGAAAAGYALGTLLMQIPLVSDAANAAGNAIGNLFGVGASPLKVPSQSVVTAARRQAGYIEAAGGSRASATQTIARQFGIDPAAAKIISGEAAGKNAPVYNIQNLHVHANNPVDFSEALARQNKAKARVR